MQKLQHVQQLHQLQQLQQQQQQLLAGRPLLKGQEALLQLQQQQQTMNRAQVPPGVNLAAAKLLEQKQLLAALQNQQLKQQLLQQQQQRTSPLQQTMMGLPPNLHAQMNRGIPTGVPVGNRTHFRPIHPHPGNCSLFLYCLTAHVLSCLFQVLHRLLPIKPVFRQLKTDCRQQCPISFTT